MPSIWQIRKRTVILCLLAVFGLGIAAERFRQYLVTNVGEVTVQRMDDGIALSIDGQSFTNWRMPLTLPAGSHQFEATWRGFQLTTVVTIKRSDKGPLNQVKYSLHSGQLQVERNGHLLDVVPRPDPEVVAIQTASGHFWHTGEGGEIVLQRSQVPGDTESFTIQWLRPDLSEAFIQSGKGRSLKDAREGNPLEARSGILRISNENDRPTVFKVDRVKGSDSWVILSNEQYFIDVGKDPKRVRTTGYEQLASPHHLIKDPAKSEIIKPVPPPPAITIAQDVSSTPTVRRFKGHTSVIRAVVFTPDGEHVISGSSDGTIRFWNTQSGDQAHQIVAHRPVMSLAISSDGKSLAGGMADGVVKTWKLKHAPKIAHGDERVLARASRGDVLSVAFSPDDRQVVAGGNVGQHTRIWNLLAPDGRCKSSTINGPVTSVVWSRSGERVLLCEEHAREIRWWPETTGNAAKKTYDPRSGKLLIRSGGDPLIVIAGDVLDAETLELVHTYQQRSGLKAISAQISSRLNLLVTGDVIINRIYEKEPDELVTLWGLETGRPLAVLRERFGQVGNLAMSPDGEHIAYGNGIRQTAYMREKTTGDYDLRVWRISNDKQ